MVSLSFLGQLLLLSCNVVDDPSHCRDDDELEQGEVHIPHVEDELPKSRAVGMIKWENDYHRMENG